MSKSPICQFYPTFITIPLFQANILGNTTNVKAKIATASIVIDANLYHQKAIHTSLKYYITS
jgi:hypothetical protein